MSMISASPPQWRSCLGCAVTILFGAVPLMSSIGYAATPYRVLFIGNSFTFGDRINDGSPGNDLSVPDLFATLAVAAGQPQPVVGMSAIGGKDFRYHAGADGDNFQGTLDAIASQPWTHIVLQNYSTEPTHATDLQGNVDEHLTYGGALYLVAMDLVPKPNVLLYETWSRAQVHPYITGISTAGTFASTDEFQDELWFNYRRLADLLNDGFPANPPRAGQSRGRCVAGGWRALAPE